MLSEARNKLLTEVGPGTRMGALLRRYWQPIAAVSELDDTATKAVRLMGEDLVLYKDLSGRYGLLDRHCPHRSADLSYGIVEDCGLRCSYHGWRFDETGACREQPFEDTDAPDPQGALSQVELREAIADSIARLPEREKLVVTLYYYEELTLREIGEVLGVTESRVSQLHTKAILRLKARLAGSATRATL